MAFLLSEQKRRNVFVFNPRQRHQPWLLPLLLFSSLTLLLLIIFSLFKFGIILTIFNHPEEFLRSEIPWRERLKLWGFRGSLVRDVLWGQSVHAMHVLDSGGDCDRVAVWVRSVQAWIPQAERHRQLLRFMRQCRRTRKTLLGLCSTATIVLVQLSLLIIIPFFDFVLGKFSGDLFVS